MDCIAQWRRYAGPLTCHGITRNIQVLTLPDLPTYLARLLITRVLLGITTPPLHLRPNLLIPVPTYNLQYTPSITKIHHT
jgi:hypothetical protein